MLNLIKNNIKFSFKWLIILIINYSCTNNLKVSEKEILSASSWSINDQLPTFKECADLEADKGLLCFRNIIEEEMNEFLTNKTFPLDTTQYKLAIKIDSEGNFILDNIDNYGFNGDYIESQAFGYLAIRSFLNLPTSFPGTTRCKVPTIGGKLVENF